MQPTTPQAAVAAATSSPAPSMPDLELPTLNTREMTAEEIIRMSGVGRYRKPASVTTALPSGNVGDDNGHDAAEAKGGA